MAHRRPTKHSQNLLNAYLPIPGYGRVNQKSHIIELNLINPLYCQIKCLVFHRISKKVSALQKISITSKPQNIAPGTISVHVCPSAFRHGLTWLRDTRKLGQLRFHTKKMAIEILCSMRQNNTRISLTKWCPTKCPSRLMLTSYFKLHDICVCVCVTFEILTVRRQQHPFPIHEQMFLRKCRFSDRKYMDRMELEPPTFRFITNTLPFELSGSYICYPIFYTAFGGVFKANIWNINCVQATVFIFGPRTDVLEKVFETYINNINVLKRCRDTVFMWLRRC